MVLQDWLSDNTIDYSIINEQPLCFEVSGFGKFIFVEAKENKLFDESFQIILSDEEIDFLDENEIDFFSFKFGYNYYYYPIDQDPVFIPLRHIGISSDFDEDLVFPYLGVHGKYEILNGSRDYRDWCKKAKFLGYKEIGICEKNTLAGVFLFINACKENDIKPIIGETISVLSKEGFVYELKVYVADQDAWNKLILINSHINVFNVEKKYIKEQELYDIDCSGLIAVLSHETTPTEKNIKMLKKLFKRVYYQIDPVEFKSNEKDREHIYGIKHYFESHMDLVDPIIICDSYYLDKQDNNIKIVLNKVKEGRSLDQSSDQYMKSPKQFITQISSFFSETQGGNKAFDAFIYKCVDSLEEVSKLCVFKYDKGDLKLPKYEMTENEKSVFKDNEDLFFTIVEEAFEKKVISKGLNEKTYLSRLETEIGVIKKGNIIDYFLILWDIIRWCKNNDVLTGPGRGSAAGSLVSYLLDITSIDPIKYNLLFERFLNEARLTGELPDIDIDFEGERRDNVKEYMEIKYGKMYVMSIGTYGNMRPKMAIKDISRVTNVSYNDANIITSMISKETNEGGFTDIFRQAVQDPKFRFFVQKHYGVFEKMQLCLGQPRSESIHASATVVIPKQKGFNAYNTLPVKKIGEQLVTEWEGKQIEKAGFLKEDILGLKQMDKFKYMINLIKKNRGVKVVLEEIDLEDKKVFDLFKQGLNEDIFQFNSDGFKSYCRELSPESIEDLIAGNALYRPGPMDVGSHIKYAKLKNGGERPQYDPFLKEVTKNTYGLPVYQEQTMQMFQVVTESTLQEADTFRKIITKTKAGKITEDVQKYKDLFINGYKEKGVSEQIAEGVWDKIISFAGYGFNRSHAAAYAIIAYWCQWFKANYPLEFWVTSLKFSSLDDIPKLISEINYLNIVKLLPPDINRSGMDFEYDTELNEIYFSISSIKGFGEKTTQKIIEKRSDGPYESVADFIKRVKMSDRLVSNLIMAGCFDKFRSVKNAKDRKFLLNELSEKFLDSFEFLSDEKKISKDYYWVLYQKEMCGIGLIDFEKHYISLGYKEKYLQPLNIDDNNIVGEYMVVSGLITEIKEFNTKKGKGAKIVLDNNYTTLTFVFWAEQWEAVSSIIAGNKNMLFYANGRVNFDKFNNKNTVYSTEKTRVELI